MKELQLKNMRNQRRKLRARRKLKLVSGESALRMSVFRSSKHIYAQLIDDLQGKTLASSSSIKMDVTKKTGVEIAREVGASFGAKIVEKGIDKKVFLDRGPYLYHGRVAAFADGVRESGVKF